MPVYSTSECLFMPSEMHDKEWTGRMTIHNTGKANICSNKAGMPIHDEQKMNIREELAVHNEKVHEHPCT